MIGQFTAAYVKRGKWIVAYVEEIPGVNTQGRTMTEAKKNLREALELILDANKQISCKWRGAKPFVEEPISILIE